MKNLRRFGLYLFGVALGSVIVLVFWDKKEATFDYGMDARTLKQIRIRKRVYSDEAKKTMFEHKIDTAQISTILKNGDVDFGKSKARIKPCPEYYVVSDKIDLYIVRCEATATVQKVIVKSE